MTKEIQKLREVTAAGVMECKRALEDAKGNFDEAVKLLRARGIEKAERKSTRATGAGLLEAYIHQNRVGVLLDIHAETDFVVRSAPFRELAHELAMQIAAMDPKDVPALLAQPYIKDATMTVEALVKSTVAKVGENIAVARFVRYEL
jgi:elongation factor Ts